MPSCGLCGSGVITVCPSAHDTFPRVCQCGMRSSSRTHRTSYFHLGRADRGHDRWGAAVYPGIDEDGAGVRPAARTGRPLCTGRTAASPGHYHAARLADGAVGSPRSKGLPLTVYSSRTTRYSSVSSTNTTSAYLVCRSNRLCSCAGWERSPTASRTTIGRKPFCTASTAVARTQPLVEQPVRMSVSTRWVLSRVTSFVRRRLSRTS